MAIGRDRIITLTHRENVQEAKDFATHKMNEKR
jgi:hypothetical protein